MSHDPFDRLRNANPLPDESLPPAPMETAEQIMTAADGAMRKAKDAGRNRCERA